VFAQARAGAWAKYIPADGKSDPINAVAKEVLREQDRVTLGFSLLARGFTTRLIVEEDYLRLLALAFSQGYEASINSNAKGGN